MALSGGYRAAPELTPSYSAIRRAGAYRSARLKRVPLPDIRSALDSHTRFILLAQPGAGKTTVLSALRWTRRWPISRTMGARSCRSLCACRRSRPMGQLPRAFLERMWREQTPGRHLDAAEGELRDALHQGRLCILADALNEARRVQYTERMHDWRDFAADLPAGNHLIFSCRKLDYAGELAVQQVEIDPLTPAQIEDFAVRYLDATQGAAFWAALQERHADLRES